MNPNLPLGIAYIGAMLQRNGYDVKMLDAFIEGWHCETRISDEKILVGMPFDEIEAFIAAESPDVVGITSMFTSQRKNAHGVAALVKKINPSIKVVVGGAHPTAAPEAVLSDPNVDVVVLGEGDNSIVPVLRALQLGKPLEDLEPLDGVGFKRRDGRMIIQHKTHQVEKLDDLPFPARHLLPMEKYFAAGVRHGGYCMGSRATSMITSRGCQYYCNFCTAFKVFTRTPRMRSVSSIVAELWELVTRYKVDEVFFEDDQFIAKQRHTEELLDMMATFKVKFDTPNGVSSWLLNETIIEKMKRAGCYRVNLAIESGNQDVLKNVINKPVRLDQLPELVRVIRKNDMEVGTFLVVGNISHKRNETLEEVRDSFRFARKLRTRPHVSYLTAYPGSEVLEVAEKNGYLAPDFDWDNLTIVKQQLTTPEWTPEQLRQVVEEERVKTQIWLWITSPWSLFTTIWSYLVQDPVLGVKKLMTFARLALSTRTRAPLKPWGA